jgi:hypothetical protein
MAALLSGVEQKPILWMIADTTLLKLSLILIFIGKGKAVK